MKDIRCMIGWHKWRWLTSEEMGLIPFAEVPDKTKCERCGRSWADKK